MAIIKTNINEVEEMFAKLDLSLICEEKYHSLKPFDWVVYTILKNQEGLSKRSYLMGNRSYVDKYNNVFIRISQEKLAALLRISIPTLRSSFKRLIKVDLLEINVVGKNECNIMYIGNPVRTITFGEYANSIGKNLEDEDDIDDFKPTIMVDNVIEFENKKAPSTAIEDASNQNFSNNESNDIINQSDINNTSYQKKSQCQNTTKNEFKYKVVSNKHNDSVNNTFIKYGDKLEEMLFKSQEGKFK